jgi:hypothetical protein
MTTIQAASYRVLPDWQVRGVALAFGLSFAAFLAIGYAAIGWNVVLLVAGIGAAGLLYAYPRQGLLVLVGLVILVEGSSAYSFIRPLDDMYRGVDNQFGVKALPASPLELGMVLVLLGAIKQRAGGGVALGPSFYPILAVCFVFLLGLAHGIQTGGDAMVGLREIRPMLYLPVIYLASANLIREREHFRELTIVFIAATLMISVGALWTHVTRIRTGELTGSLDLVFSHENALFAGMLILFCIGMFIWTKDHRLRLLLSLPALIALAGLLVMKRRVGIIALDAGVLLMAIALLRTNTRAALMLLPLMAVLGILYLGAYWNETGGLGQGARSFRTVIGQESTAEDQSSRDYRDIEASNVSQNIRWHPVWGSGFGHEYEFVQPLPDLSAFWPMQPYIPHNTILWSWMKGGLAALLVVFGLFGYALTKGMGLVNKRFDPLLKAWTMAATAAVIMVFLFAWWDLGLVSLRLMTVFGLCLGLLGTLGAMAETTLEEERASPDGQNHGAQ